MHHSESIGALAKALSAAQGEVENAHKTSDNPFFRSKYADLSEIINTVRPVLAKHGLSVVQIPGCEGETVTVETVLMHESGEWIGGVSAAPMSKQYAKDGRELPPSPQGVGSAITYLRRYSLAAVCNIAQEDDDAEAATSRTPAASKKAPIPKPRAAPDEGTPECPACGGAMWDNRQKKADGQMKANAPDFKCRDKECDGVYWPGQWPPKATATTDQRAALMAILAEFVHPPSEPTKKEARAVTKASVLVDDADATGEAVEAATEHLRALLETLRSRDSEKVAEAVGR